MRCSYDFSLVCKSSELYASFSVLKQIYFRNSPTDSWYIGMKTNIFQSCGHCWVFHICWHTECSTFTASSFSSVQFSRSVMSDSWRPHELQHSRPPCPSPSPRVHSNICPTSRWSFQSSHPLSPPLPPAPNPSQHQSLFQWVNSSHEVAKVLEFQL